MELQYVAAFGGLQAKLQQMKVVVCCLDGENLVDICKDSWRIATNWKRTMKLTESALSRYSVQLLISFCRMLNVA